MDCYRKKVLILAKSKKFKHTCIAGVSIDNPNSLHLGKAEWIRPVDLAYNDAITSESMMLGNKNGNPRELRLLDIVSIPFKESILSEHQSENIAIFTSGHFAEIRWDLELDPFNKKNKDYISLLNERQSINKYLRSICRNQLDWPNHSSSTGINDRVLYEERGSINYSLALVETQLKAYLKNGQIRGVFNLGGVEYDLSITDLRFEKWFRGVDENECSFDRAFICLSLGELFKGFYYKLIAGLFIFSEESLT